MPSSTSDSDCSDEAGFMSDGASLPDLQFNLDPDLEQEPDLLLDGEAEPVVSHSPIYRGRNRTSSGINNHQNGHRSAHLIARPDLSNDEKYFEAYWANIRHQRRQDPLSLPLVPYTDVDYGIMDGKNRYSVAPQNARAYPSPRSRRPLIDFISNEWRHTSNSSRSPHSERNNPTWTLVLTAPRFRRYASICFLLLTIFLVNWIWWADPEWGENSRLDKSLKKKMEPSQGSFGTNMRPTFRDMIQLKTIDQALIPKKGDNARLIIVGDVHGCREELVALLAEVDYNARLDHLILVGDMISKGPDSPAVVDLAMSMRASCVRGNHEDRVLLAYRDLNSPGLTARSSGKPAPPSPGPFDAGKPAPPDKKWDGERFAHGDAVDRELARSLSQKQIDYLAACPVILKLGYVRAMGELQVVHAGLVPGVELEKQDPMGVMYMRTMDLETLVPSSSSDGTPWNKLWNRYQTYLPEKNRSTVVYGHDSRRGLQLTPYTKGLDTGCVKGGRLTALVIGGDTSEERGSMTYSVECKDYRSLAAQQSEKLGGMGQS